ncbi:MAG: hypothetical protein A2W23_02245 [Planctomycetes bacterium RBG_16_43_13]|nr:MAG: hypothetical protein A2W23_02245 [Planctomycetes bacterium RBG_16_43_13]
MDVIISKLRDPWLILGFAGQFVFLMRWVVQWIVSERKKMSVTPISFWYISLGGATITLIYSIHKEDPVFIFAQIVSSLIYARHLILINKNRQTPQD